MPVRPLGKKVLIAENKRETSTASGIILEGSQGLGESKTGTVLAIGPAALYLQPVLRLLLAQ